MTAIPRPDSFEKLHHRHRIQAEVVAVSGLRVGAGKSFDAAATDQPVIRDALGRPYIPGSSLKGALRSGLEGVLRGLGRRDLWACEIFEEGGSCVGDSAEDKIRAERGESIPLAEVLDRSCTSCALFGSPFVAGRVFFHDLPRLQGAPTEVRDGVGIHRDLGNAKLKVKYDVEVVPAGSRFQLELLLENVDPVRLDLLLQALNLVHRGEILLGGLTSRGLGRVELHRRTLERTDAGRLLTGAGYEALAFDRELERSGERLRRLLLDEEASDA